MFHSSPLSSRFILKAFQSHSKGTLQESCFTAMAKIQAMIGPSILNADLSQLYDESQRLIDNGADYLVREFRIFESYKINLSSISIWMSWTEISFRT